jgi:hypothetical protein
VFTPTRKRSTTGHPASGVCPPNASCMARAASTPPPGSSSCALVAPKVATNPSPWYWFTSPPLGFFLPGLELYPAPGDLTGPRDLVAPLIVPDQSVKCHRCLPLKPFPREKQPIVKDHALFEGKALQETTSIESDRLLQLRAGGPILVVCPTRRHQCLERPHVDPAVTGTVELDRLAGGQWIRWRGVGIIDRFSKLGEGVAEIAASRLLWPVGPQEPGQDLAPVWALGFHRQIGQQRANLGRRQASDRLSGQRNPQGPQQAE